MIVTGVAGDALQARAFELLTELKSTPAEVQLQLIRQLATASGQTGMVGGQAIDLDAALANLPSVSRSIVWLHDVEGFTHKEIAKMMGRTESFSKSQLSRAYQKLRPMLATGDAETEATDALRSF